MSREINQICGLPEIDQNQSVQTQAQAMAMQAQQNISQYNISQYNPALGQIAQGAVFSKAPAPAYSEKGLSTKVSQKICRALDQLPMSICAHIDRIEFWQDPMRFTVVFGNQHKVSFDDVDRFPAEEHIARIALECP